MQVILCCQLLTKQKHCSLHNTCTIIYIQKRRTLQSQGHVMIHVWQRVSQTELTLILLTWRIWWAPNNASRWQMGFNLAFKGLSRIGTMYWRKKSTDVFRMRCGLCCKIVASSNCPYYQTPAKFSRTPGCKQHIESQKDRTVANFSTVLFFDKWAFKICLWKKASCYVHISFITSTGKLWKVRWSA